MSSPRVCAPQTRIGLWREVWWIVQKDLRTEGRTLRALGLSGLLATGVVVACAVAGDRASRAELAGAAIWLSVVFCGVFASSNAYRREQATGALLAILCGPLRTLSLYLGKTLIIGLITGVGALVAVTAVALLIHPGGLLAWPGHLLLVVGAGTLGLTVIGGLVAPLLGLGAGREAMLALVLLPLGVPVVVSGARATAALFAADASLDVYQESLGLVVGLDALFFALSLWLFGPLVRRRG